MVSYVKNGAKVPVGGSIDNAVMLYGVYEIVTATDINNINIVGNYFKELQTFKCTNLPTEASQNESQWRLRVESRLGPMSSHITQILTIASSGDTYRRIYDGAWGDWINEGADNLTSLTDSELLEVKNAFSL